jgi:hypothetical protein
MSFKLTQTIPAQLDTALSTALEPQNTLQLCPPLQNLHEEEIVDVALSRLQSACIQLVEWRALLFARMNVPVVVRVR